MAPDHISDRCEYRLVISRRGACHMCVDASALPPIRPVSGASVNHRELVLEASDGNQFAAFEAYADQRSDAAVIVLPDVRGLFGFYQQLAER